MTDRAKRFMDARQGRQPTNTDFLIFSMDSFGGTTKLTDDALNGLAEAGSLKGYWEGKTSKLLRKFRTTQSVVMARTYADKASLRVSELLKINGNRQNTQAGAPPIGFPLELALAHLDSICC